jgi:hypothetical protein
MLAASGMPEPSGPTPIPNAYLAPVDKLDHAVMYQDISDGSASIEL